VHEELSEKQRTTLIRRSYSISSPIFDQHGYLTSRSDAEVLEFYIVLVRPDGDRVPSFTPRLALKAPGERIYLGAKVAGRYTLERNQDPFETVLFFGTGTGEAPHNAMVTELLRKGHMGTIVNAVTVRYSHDLAYRTKHEELARRFANYHYLALPTREVGVPKRYLQDAITDGTIEGLLGSALDPTNTHAFLCGNPAMIGLPEWEGEGPVFPGTQGVVELLMERGFDLDRRGHHGNIHYEEYW
jgi:ferredoxin--NADP+ reductase